MKQLVIAVLVGAASAGVAQATVINVGNPNNFFTGSTVTASSPGISGFGPFTGNPQTVVDNLAAAENQDLDFIFADDGTNDRLSFSSFGTHAGAVDLRLFIAPEDPNRVPALVTAYSSTSNQTSTNTSDYTLLGSEAVPTTFTGYDPSTTGAHRGYFDFPVVFPTGTQSILVSFSGSVTGVRIYELQALAPEPASCATMMIGAGLLAMRRRSR